MQNAQLIGLSRQTALKRQLDVIANNLANMNTTGFRGQDVLMREYEMPVAKANAFMRPDRPLSYVEDIATIDNQASGEITQTGNTYDVAIGGKGWFSIQTPNGVRYTRDGAFTTNLDGQLVTADGNPVLGDGGPITFQSDETDITIARDGTVSSSAGIKGRLAIVEFADERQMTREGETLYGGTGGTPATGVSVLQGALERSNVKAVAEMTRLVEVTRAYTSIAKTLKDMDDLRSNAINTLGQTKA